MDEVADILVEDGFLASPGTPAPPGVRIVDCRGLWLLPGLTDMHVHLREPGDGRSETYESGLRAAIAGGFTRVAPMPNTSPPTDSPAMIAEAVERSSGLGLAGIVPVGCVTLGRGGGTLAPLAGMASAGARAFSDDGSPVADGSLLAEAVRICGELGVTVIEHPEDASLSAGGAVNEGPVSRVLGLRGIPAASETRGVERALSAAAGGRIHLTHLSLPESVSLCAEAVSGGARVTCDVTPHHLALDETAVIELGADAKMNPPLRSPGDRKALVGMVAAGMVDAVASDHAPHAACLKEGGLAGAAFGVTGLETALSVTLGVLTGEAGMSPADCIALFTTGPEAILGLPHGGFTPGAPLEAVLFDPSEEWVPARTAGFSASSNSPFRNRTLKGRVRAVWRNGLAFMEGRFV